MQNTIDTNPESRYYETFFAGRLPIFSVSKYSSNKEDRVRAIILPKTYIEKIEDPIIFLAGPIKSAPDWQFQAIELLFERNSDITIALPRTKVAVNQTHYIVHGDNDKFSRKRLWERHYMSRAAQKGVLLFWLPGELQHNCAKVYGAMTRVELGEWMTRLELDRTLRVCFGSDGDFPELDIICCDLEAHTPGKVMHKTLEDTCRVALELALS